MDEDFLHTDGPFAIPSFPVKPDNSAEDAAVKLEPLPLLEDHQPNWLQTHGDLNDDVPDIDSPSEVWTDEFSIPPLESVPDQPETINDHDDIWKLSAEDPAVPSPKPSKAWEQFNHPAFQISCRYLRQAEPGAFDIILRLCDPDEEDTRPVKPDVFLNSLFQLGLGRDSILFSFDKKGSVIWRDEDARLSGLSSPATRSVVDAFTQSGKLFRAIRHLGSYVYRKGRFPTATVAFAQVSGTILLELERSVNARRPAKSLIRLQDDFKLPFKVLTLLYDIFKGLRTFETDQQALSFLYEIGQEVEMSELCLAELMHKILSHASRPWLDSVAACVGITENDAASSRLRRELESSIDWGGTLENDSLSDEAFPVFFSVDDRRLVMQVFQGMKVLEDRQGSSTLYKRSEGDLQLRWLFTWDDIIDAEHAAQMLDEATDRSADPPHAKPKDDYEEGDLHPGQDALVMLHKSYSRIENLTTSDQSCNDSLVRAIHCALDTSHVHSILSTQPALDICAAQSFNALLRHRARAVNRACLAELFQPSNPIQPHLSLNLSDHMRLLHNFFLMNHGMFVTRLSHALFDPSLTSSERSKGQVRAGGHVGLRLGSRVTWPPASSELQLALAGVLVTSFAEDQTGAGTSNAISNSSSSTYELPGRLSFALRDLSDEEIEQCLDPDGLEALDFLRISYTPPRPLDVVILPEVLEKYDRVFMLLLRLQRLVFVVNHVFQSYRMTSLRGNSQLRAAGASKDDDAPPAALRLAHAAHHLVTAFMEYVLTSAIAGPWKRFSAAITALQNVVDTYAREKRSRHNEEQESVPSPATYNLSPRQANSTSPSTPDLTSPPAPMDQTRPPSSRASTQSQRITERHGIEHLRRLHERTLDEILDGCLLRRRHERVRKLLDDVFRIILEFAAVKREQELDDANDGDSDDEEQYIQSTIRRKNRNANNNNNKLYNDADDDSDNDSPDKHRSLKPETSSTSSSSSGSEFSQTSHTTQTHQGATGRSSSSPSPLRSSGPTSSRQRRDQQRGERGQTRRHVKETQDQESAREERRHERELVIGQLYARFRRQVALFVTVCRGLVARKDEGGSGSGGGGRGFEGDVGEGHGHAVNEREGNGRGWDDDDADLGLAAGINGEGVAAATGGGGGGGGGGLEALVTRLSVNDFYGEKLVR